LPWESPPLFYYCQDIVLPYDDELVVAYFNFRTRVLGVDYFVAGFYFHFNFLAVYFAAGAYCQYLGLLGLFFGLAWQYDAGFCGFFRFQLLDYYAVA